MDRRYDELHAVHDAEEPLVYLYRRALNPLLRQPVHSGVRIDGRELTDPLRVVRQVQPRPEANLQNVAGGVGEQFSAVPSQEGLVQEEIAKTWDNCLREEAHSLLQICLAWAGPFVAILLACRHDETKSSGGGRASSWSARLQPG